MWDLALKLLSPILKPFVEKVGGRTVERFFGPSLIFDGLEVRDMSDLCPNAISGYVLRIKITNVGQETAKNCNAEIVLDGEGNGTRMRDFSQNLPWNGQCGKETVSINSEGGSEWINVVVIEFEKTYFPSPDKIDNFIWPPFEMSSQEAHWPRLDDGTLSRVPHWSKHIDYRHLVHMDWDINEIRVTCGPRGGVTEQITFKQSPSQGKFIEW